MRTRYRVFVAGLTLALSFSLNAGAGWAVEGTLGKSGKDPPPSANEAADAALRLERAHTVFGRNEYAKARTLFRQIAEDAGTPAKVAAEARFYEAESLRRQGLYPQAACLYLCLIADFPASVFREKTIQHLFDIADYWLNDTREEIQARFEQQEGRRRFVLPVSFIHLDKGKPFFDEEGQAVQVLWWVYHNDPAGPLAAKALWYMGNVRLLREDYGEAGAFFEELVQKHPSNELAPKAIELAIVCRMKSLFEGDVGVSQLAEARKLLDKFRRDYPVEAATKAEFLSRTNDAINRMSAR